MLGSKYKNAMWGDALGLNVRDYIGNPVKFGQEVYMTYDIYGIVATN